MCECRYNKGGVMRVKKKNWILFLILLGVSMTWGVLYWVFFVIE